MRTYYLTVVPADLSQSGHREDRISSRKPACSHLRGGERIYRVRCSSIKEVCLLDTPWRRAWDLEA
jgi:hypothetical protein